MGSIVRPLLVLSVAHVCSCWHSRPAPRHRRLPLRSQSDQHPTPTTWNYDHQKDGEVCWVPTSLSLSLVSTETYRWCTNFVLPLNLCPWAAGSVQTEGAIHIFVVKDTTEMASAVYEAAVRLLDTVEGDNKVHARYAINFVVCDTHDWTFEEFNGWFEDLEEAFWDDPVVGESVTLAPFHPDWQFDSGNNDNGETQQQQDAVAFEKKSPYPTVTIVCTSVIDQAGEAVTQQIADHNEDRLLQEGTTRLQKLYEKNVLWDRSTEDPS